MHSQGAVCAWQESPSLCHEMPRGYERLPAASMSHWGLPVLASFGLLAGALPGVLPGVLRGSFEGLFLGACCACLPLVKVLKYRATNTTAVPSLQGAREGLETQDDEQHSPPKPARYMNHSTSSPRLVP